MKKLFALLSVVCLLVVNLSACTAPGENSEESASSDNVKIGLSIGTMTDERWQRDVDYFEAKSEELGFSLTVQSADQDAQKQASQCENMIASGIDVLIVQAVDSDAAGVIGTMAEEEGVTLIAYDRLIKSGPVDYYVTFDNVKVGEVQAEFVLAKAPEGNYIWLKGEQSDNNAHLVYEGQKNVMQKYIDDGSITIVAEQWCDSWMPDQALMHVENALTANNNDIQGIMAPNDGTAGGAIQALEAQGLAGSIPIAGQDADLAACKRIVAGTQTGTVYKPTRDLNDAIIEIALMSAKGEDPVNNISVEGSWSTTDNNFTDVTSFFLDVVAVDKDNIVDTVIADGFHSMEEVYADIPKDQWPAVE